MDEIDDFVINTIPLIQTGENNEFNRRIFNVKILYKLLGYTVITNHRQLSKTIQAIIRDLAVLILEETMPLT